MSDKFKILSSNGVKVLVNLLFSNLAIFEHKKELYK
jgi:hypothetical protein